jgi:hypothetical protein
MPFGTLVAAMRIVAVDRPDVPPMEMPPRFKRDIHYFMTPPGEHDAPKLPPGEYWIRLEEARHWLDEGSLQLVSPLDSENKADVEITEEQEQWLEWLLANQVQHVKIEP